MPNSDPESRMNHTGALLFTETWTSICPGVQRKGTTEMGADAMSGTASISAIMDYLGPGFESRGATSFRGCQRRSRHAAGRDTVSLVRTHKFHICSSDRLTPPRQPCQGSGHQRERESWHEVRRPLEGEQRG